MDYAWKTGRVKQGKRVMPLAIETSKWIYAGQVLTWTAGPFPVPVDSKSGAATTA